MMPNAISASAYEPAIVASERHVTFQVAGEIYAVPASHVREVIRWSPTTRVPNGIPAVKGVINLRGEIVTVLDVRVLLALPPVAPSDRTCIVVVTVRHAESRLQAGLIVDTALDVTAVAESDIERPAKHTGTFVGDYVAGIARTPSGLVLLLDVQRLVACTLAPASGPA